MKKIIPVLLLTLDTNTNNYMIEAGDVFLQKKAWNVNAMVIYMKVSSKLFTYVNDGRTSDRNQSRYI